MEIKIQRHCEVTNNDNYLTVSRSVLDGQKEIFAGEAVYDGGFFGLDMDEVDALNDIEDGLGDEVDELVKNASDVDGYLCDNKKLENMDKLADYSYFYLKNGEFANQFDIIASETPIDDDELDDDELTEIDIDEAADWSVHYYNNPTTQWYGKICDVDGDEIL